MFKMNFTLRIWNLNKSNEKELPKKLKESILKKNMNIFSIVNNGKKKMETIWKSPNNG